MPESRVITATPAVNFDGLVLHLENTERTLLGAKQFNQFVGGNISAVRARHLLKNATVSYTVVKVGDDIGNGAVATKDGHKIDILVLSDRKSDLICTLEEQKSE